MSSVVDPSLPTIDVESTTGVFCPDLWTYIYIGILQAYFAIKNR